MFPSNLHKNILQLDKQISLLENECKHLDIKKRRKTINIKQPQNKCSKISYSRSKSPIQKVGVRKSFDSSKKFKKISPPISSRVHSTSSLPSNCSKQCSTNCNANQCEPNKNHHICLCQMIVNAKKHVNLENRLSELPKFSCKDVSLIEHEKIAQKNFIENSIKKNSDCILHKEVLFSNPGSTIEVTITKRHNADSQTENFSPKNSINSEKWNEKCQLENNTPSEQKWSDILRTKPLKQREDNHMINDISDKFSKENNGVLIQHFLNSADNKFRDKAFSETQYNTNIKKKDGFTPPVKLIESPKQKKSMSNTKINSEGDFIKKNSDSTNIKTSPVMLFQLLVNELEKKSNEEKLLSDIKLREKDTIVPKILMENNSDTVKNFETKKNDLFQIIQKLCENLIAEKETISKELEAKNNMISTMKKREDEYVALISNLQNNVEKAKQNIPSSINAVKELSSLKEKLMEQVKITDALKKSHMQLKEILDKCALENDRLKTEIQIYKLESQKHEVLMAGKEAEIKHYKEEIKNFQNQISEHLASLKSNAQAIDLKQMMEAIIQQSQIFTKDDLDSIIVEGDLKDGQKPKKLIHSSPTSSKTSLINSSWKQISSIRDNEPEVFLNPNNDNKFLKDFIENLSSDSESLKINEKNSKNDIKKKSSSFTSCVSVNDEDVENEMPTLINNHLSKAEKVKPKKKEGIGNSSSEKVKISIDELLKGMKLKWSKEVYGASLNNNSVEDISSASQLSK